MEQTTRITLAWELDGQGLGDTRIARRPSQTPRPLSVNRETVNRRVAGVTAKGRLPFLDPFGWRQVPVSLKQSVWHSVSARAAPAVRSANPDSAEQNF
jgi:hypothetical protein